MIQLDTFDQGINYESEIFILDKFDLFEQIRVTPKSVILSQKLWTVTRRKQFKGRDFYDIMHLFQTTRPDMKFLKGKFKTHDFYKIKEIILKKIQLIDWNQLVKDVKPFLFNSKDAEKIRLFPDFLRQIKF